MTINKKKNIKKTTKKGINEEIKEEISTIATKTEISKEDNFLDHINLYLNIKRQCLKLKHLTCIIGFMIRDKFVKYEKNKLYTNVKKEYEKTLKLVDNHLIQIVHMLSDFSYPFDNYNDYVQFNDDILLIISKLEEIENKIKMIDEKKYNITKAEVAFETKFIFIMIDHFLNKK